MGTIIKRKRKDGTASWLAQIAVRRAGKTVWRENRTFELRSTAAAWIEKREKDLANPGALENLPIGETRRREVTLGDAIDKYVEDSAKAIGRTKAQVLKSIKEFDIANKLCAQIDSADIVAFAKEKLNTGVSPQTVSNYLSHLSAVFTVAGPAWNYPLDERAMRNAMIVAKKLGLLQTMETLLSDVYRDAPIGSAGWLALPLHRRSQIVPDRGRARIHGAPSHDAEPRSQIRIRKPAPRRRRGLSG